MPDANGKLTRQEQEKANEIFTAFEKERGGDMVCSLCGGIRWALAEYLTSIPVPTGMPFSTRNIPAVTYVCTNCGHLHFFSAVYFGFKVDPPKEDKKSDAE